MVAEAHHPTAQTHALTRACRTSSTARCASTRWISRISTSAPAAAGTRSAAPPCAPPSLVRPRADPARAPHRSAGSATTPSPRLSTGAVQPVVQSTTRARSRSAVAPATTSASPLSLRLMGADGWARKRRLLAAQRVRDERRDELEERLSARAKVRVRHRTRVQVDGGSTAEVRAFFFPFL